LVCIGVLLSTFGWQSRVFVCCEEKHLSDIAFSYFCEFCCVARKTDQNFPQPVVQEELNFHDNLLQIRCCYLPEDIFYAKNSFQRCCFSFFLLVTETRFFSKCWCLPIRLHGVTYLKTPIFTMVLKICTPRCLFSSGYFARMESNLKMLIEQSALTL
jgi:hypothetical protein